MIEPRPMPIALEHAQIVEPADPRLLRSDGRDFLPVPELAIYGLLLVCLPAERVRRVAVAQALAVDARWTDCEGDLVKLPGRDVSEEDFRLMESARSQGLVDLGRGTLPSGWIYCVQALKDVGYSEALSQALDDARPASPTPWTDLPQIALIAESLVFTD